MPNLKDIDLTLLKDLRDEKELRCYFLSKGTKLTDEDIVELKNLFNFIKNDENSLTLQQLSEIAGGAKLIFKNGKFHAVDKQDGIDAIVGFEFRTNKNNSLFAFLSRSRTEEKTEYKPLTECDAINLEFFFFNDENRENRFENYRKGRYGDFFFSSESFNKTIVDALIEYYSRPNHEEFEFEKKQINICPTLEESKFGQEFTQSDTEGYPGNPNEFNRAVTPTSPFTATEQQQQVRKPTEMMPRETGVYSAAYAGLPPVREDVSAYGDSGLSTLRVPNFHTSGGQSTDSRDTGLTSNRVCLCETPSSESKLPQSPSDSRVLVPFGSTGPGVHALSFDFSQPSGHGEEPSLYPPVEASNHCGGEYTAETPGSTFGTTDDSKNFTGASAPMMPEEGTVAIEERASERISCDFGHLGGLPEIKFDLVRDCFDGSGRNPLAEICSKIISVLGNPVKMMTMARFAIQSLSMDDVELIKLSDPSEFENTFNTNVVTKVLNKARETIEKFGLDNDPEVYKMLSMSEIQKLKFVSEDKRAASMDACIIYNGLQIIKLYCLSFCDGHLMPPILAIKEIQEKQNLFFPMKNFCIDLNANGLVKQEPYKIKSSIALRNFFTLDSNDKIVMNLNSLERFIRDCVKTTSLGEYKTLSDVFPANLFEGPEVERYNARLNAVALTNGGKFNLRDVTGSCALSKPGEKNCTTVKLSKTGLTELTPREGQEIFLENTTEPLTYGQIFLLTKDYYLHSGDKTGEYKNVDLTKLSLSLIAVENLGVKDQTDAQIYNFTKIILFECLRILNTNRKELSEKLISIIIELVKLQDILKNSLSGKREQTIVVPRPETAKSRGSAPKTTESRTDTPKPDITGAAKIPDASPERKVPDPVGKTFGWARDKIVMETANNQKGNTWYLSFSLKKGLIPTARVEGDGSQRINVREWYEKLPDKSELEKNLLGIVVIANEILDDMEFDTKEATIRSLIWFYNTGEEIMPFQGTDFNSTNQNFINTIDFIRAVLGLGETSPLLRILRETNFQLSYTAVRDSNGNRTSKLSPISPDKERINKLIVLTKYVFDVIGSGQCDEVTLDHSIKLLLSLESELLKRKRSEDYTTLNEEIGKLGKINPDRLKRAIEEQKRTIEERKRNTRHATPQPPKTASFVLQPGPEPIGPRHLVGGSALPDGIEKGWLDANGQLQPEHFEEVFTHIFDQVIRLLGDGKNIPDYLAQYKACMPDHFEMGLRALLPFKGHPEYARRVFELRKAYIGKLSEKYPGKNLSQIPIAERRTVFDKLNASVCLDRAWGSKRPLVAMFDPKGSGNQAVDIDGLTLHSREGETRGEWQTYGRKFTADHHDSKSGRCYKAGEHTDLSRLLDFTLIDPDLCAFTLRSVATAKCFGHEVDFGKIGETPCYREVPGQLSSENIKSLLGRPRFNNGRSIFYTSVFTNVLEKENPGLVAIVNPSNAEWPGGGAGFPGLKGAGEEIMMRTYPGLFPAIHSEAWSRLTSVSHDQGRGNIFNPAVILSEVMSPDTGEPVSFISGAAPDLRSYSSFELFVSAASIIAYNTNPALRRLYEDYTRALVRNMFTAAVASGRPILEIVELGMGAFLGNSDFNVKEKMRSILFDIYSEVYTSYVVPGHPEFGTFNQYFQLVMCGTGSLPRELTDQRGFVPLGRDLKINLKDEPQPTAQPQMTIAAPQSRSFGFPQPMPAPGPQMQFNPQGDIQGRPSAQPQTTPELLGKITFYLDFSKDVLKRELCTYDSLVSIVNIPNNAQIISEARRALTEPEYWNTIGPIVEKAFPNIPVLQGQIKAKINNDGILFMMTEPEQASKFYEIDMKMINATIDVYRLLNYFSGQDLSRDPKAIKERDKCLALFCLLAKAMMEKTGVGQDTKESWRVFTDWVISVVRQKYINPANS